MYIYLGGGGYFLYKLDIVHKLVRRRKVFLSGKLWVLKRTVCFGPEKDR